MLLAKQHLVGHTSPHEMIGPLIVGTVIFLLGVWLGHYLEQTVWRERRLRNARWRNRY
jgi:hypothetical protein